MSEFPVLKTGAITQYPVQTATKFSTQIVRFVDGSEQRFRDYPSPLRRWTVQLDLLDESEMHLVREFFRLQGGASAGFTFTDPWDGTKYTNCSVDQDELREEVRDQMQGRTSLIVRENRG